MITLDEKNRKLKEENEWLKKSIKRQRLSNEECSKYLEELVKENEQLKASNVEMEDYLGRLEERIQELETFIKKIADNNGNIVLINGYEYNIKKVILNE